MQNAANMVIAVVALALFCNGIAVLDELVFNSKEARKR